MKDLPELFTALGNSPFRRKFRLYKEELNYLRHKGLDTVLTHANDFIRRRLAPALPANDGRQTPWRKHPVFVAQHATATCCRACLEKWHDIPAGRELTEEEVNYILTVIAKWLSSY